MGVKYFLLLIAMVGQSSLAADEKPVSKEQLVIVEKAIRQHLKKPTGELTKSDLKKVTGLDLHNTGRTKITDAGIKELSKLPKLSILVLGGHKITDAGLKEVGKLKKLKNLYLVGTKVTKAGVAELRKALPKCNIIRAY